MEKGKEKEKEEIKFSKGFTGVERVGRQPEGVFLVLNTEKNAEGEKVFVPTIKAHQVEEIEKLFKGSSGVAIGIKKEEDKDSIELIPTDTNYVRKIIRESGSIRIVIRRFLKKVAAEQYEYGENIELSWRISGASLFIELPENIRAK